VPLHAPAPQPPRRDQTNEVKLAQVEPLARDLLRFLGRDPDRPFYGEIKIILTVADGVVQVVAGGFKGSARPASVAARALRVAG
jgi:hypothetical protein